VRRRRIVLTALPCWQQHDAETALCAMTYYARTDRIRSIRNTPHPLEERKANAHHQVDAKKAT
jgi:hypothetical protein